MLRHVLRRGVAGLLVLLATVTLTFWAFFAGPFDSVRVICGENCTPQRYDTISASLDADDALPVQLAHYLGGIVAGRDVPLGGITIHCSAPCLGISYDQRRPVTELIGEAMPVTISIALGAAVVSLVVGVALGALAARYRGGLLDRAILTVSMTLAAVPFVVVVLLAYVVFVVRLDWFSREGYHPLFGSGPFWSDAASWAWSLTPTWLLLGVFGAAGYGRFSRGLIIETLGEDYIQTATAKGLRERTVLRRHALRAAYPPIVTIFSLDLAGLLSGALFVEQIFGLRGIGRLAFNSVGQRDLPVLVGTTLFAAAVVVVGNIIADVLHARLDPRVRFR